MAVFIKRELPNFYDLLSRQMNITLDGIHELNDYLYDLSQERYNKIIDLEKQADRVRIELIKALEETFITPFEREDIFRLSGDIDDIMDNIYEIAYTINIFRLEPREDDKEIVKIIMRSIEALNNAVERLGAEVNDEQWDYLKVAKKCEKIAKEKYRRCIQKMIEEEEMNLLASVIKQRELYRSMRHLAEQVNLAADIVGRIKVKMI